MPLSFLALWSVLPLFLSFYAAIKKRLKPAKPGY